MTEVNYVQAFVEGLNRFLSSIGEPPIHSGNLWLARDENIHVDGIRWTLSRSDIIPVDQFDQVFGSGLSAGPYWIHANLIRTNEGTPLISVLMGKGEGASRPRIDLSAEAPDKVVEIIE